MMYSPEFLTPLTDESKSQIAFKYAYRLHTADRQEVRRRYLAAWSPPPSIRHALTAVKAMSVSRLSYLLIVLTLPADVLYS